MKLTLRQYIMNVLQNYYNANKTAGKIDHATEAYNLLQTIEDQGDVAKIPLETLKELTEDAPEETSYSAVAGLYNMLYSYWSKNNAFREKIGRKNIENGTVIAPRSVSNTPTIAELTWLPGVTNWEDIPKWNDNPSNDKNRPERIKERNVAIVAAAEALDNAAKNVYFSSDAYTEFQKAVHKLKDSVKHPEKKLNTNDLLADALEKGQKYLAYKAKDAHISAKGRNRVNTVNAIIRNLSKAGFVDDANSQIILQYRDAKVNAASRKNRIAREQEIDVLEKNNTKLEKQNSQLKNENAKLNNSVVNVQKSADELRKENDALKIARENEKKAQEELKKLQAEYTALMKRYNDHEDIHEEAINRLNDRTNELYLLQTDMEELQKRMAEMKEALQKTQNESLATKAEVKPSVADMQVQTEDAQSPVAEADVQTEKVQPSVEELPTIENKNVLYKTYREAPQDDAKLEADAHNVVDSIFNDIHEEAELPDNIEPLITEEDVKNIAQEKEPPVEQPNAEEVPQPQSVDEEPQQVPVAEDESEPDASKQVSAADEENEPAEENENLGENEHKPEPEAEPVDNTQPKHSLEDAITQLQYNLGDIVAPHSKEETNLVTPQYRDWDEDKGEVPEKKPQKAVLEKEPEVVDEPKNVSPLAWMYDKKSYEPKPDRPVETVYFPRTPMKTVPNPDNLDVDDEGNLITEYYGYTDDQSDYDPYTDPDMEWIWKIDYSKPDPERDMQRQAQKLYLNTSTMANLPFLAESHTTKQIDAALENYCNPSKPFELFDKMHNPLGKHVLHEFFNLDDRNLDNQTGYAVAQDVVANTVMKMLIVGDQIINKNDPNAGFLSVMTQKLTYDQFKQLVCSCSAYTVGGTSMQVYNQLTQMGEDGQMSQMVEKIRKEITPRLQLYKNGSELLERSYLISKNPSKNVKTVLNKLEQHIREIYDVNGSRSALFGNRKRISPIQNSMGNLEFGDKTAYELKTDISLIVLKLMLLNEETAYRDNPASAPLMKVLDYNRGYGELVVYIRSTDAFKKATENLTANSAYKLMTDFSKNSPVNTLARNVAKEMIAAVKDAKAGKTVKKDEVADKDKINMREPEVAQFKNFF